METQGSSKYEYMLETWGGFYNQEHREKHGYSPGFFWFDTADERDRYVSELRAVEKRLGAHHLVIRTAAGTSTRLRTIAKMTLVYRGTEYPLEYDFGFSFPPEGAEFMFTKGNYFCDCNRSLFLNREYPDFPELECGDEIEMKTIEIVLRG